MIDISSKRKYYHIYQKRKPSGKIQKIFSVLEPLKSEQNKLKNKYESQFDFSEHLYGFIKGKNTVSLAKKHCQKDWVITLDIKDYFPSIKKEMLTQLGLDEYETEIATYNDNLVFGSPCSPVLSNMYMSPIINELNQYFREIDESIYIGAYADDISLSGNVIKPNWKMVKHIESILDKYGLKINEKKTRFMFKNQRQEVLGICVNTLPSLNRKIRSQLKFREKRDMLTEYDIGMKSYLNSINVSRES